MKMINYFVKRFFKKQQFILFVTLYISLLYFSCQDKVSDDLEFSHYDVRLKILPEEQYIEVAGSLKYLITDDSLSELSFNLHKGLEISDFSVNGDDSYQLDTANTEVRWLPDAMKIVYPTKNKFNKGEVVNIEFSYQGKITDWPSWSANVINADWVEIGLYFPWYPSIYGEFTYKVAIDVTPEFNTFAIGRYSEKENLKVFETDFPVTDFIICASKDLAIRKTQLLNQSFQIVSSTLSNAVVDSIQADIENFYQLYSSLFGEIQVNNMCLVVSKRKKGGGYSRKGGLFLGGMSDSSYLNKRLDYIQYIAHEISHFWWNGAPGNWEDWLNESFAEYSALLVIREQYSKEEYKVVIDMKKNKSMNTPPIWGISRNHPKATEVLYDKGVLLLSELEQKMGSQKFYELCKARIDKKVKHTQDFLSLVNSIGGKDIADWFEQSLKTR